ncbi:MAG: ABC transporter permease [Candidatus Hydrogenedentes bacterium]|nr:ABC transporter permease [Candidatus Hydrogenedentota bacterium]
MPSNLTIYTPESKVRRPRTILREMARGMWRSPYISYRLFLKDLKSEYSRAAFGLLWDFVDPLILGTIFYFLMRADIFNAGTMGIPYSVFVIFGVLLFQTFVEATLQPLDVIGRSKVMLMQLKLTPEALILSVGYRVLFNSLFRVVIMLLFTLLNTAWAFQLIQQLRGTPDAVIPPQAIHFAPLGFAGFFLMYPIMILAGMSIGVALAPFNVLYSDIGKVTRILMTPLRYLSPVLYTLHDRPLLDQVERYNPLAPLLNNLRTLATEGYFPDPTPFSICAGGFVLFFCLGWLFFHIAIPVLADRA